MASNEISKEFRFFRVYKGGRLEFFDPPCQKLPPSDDPSTGVRSKDVDISSELHISARIFLPQIPNPNQKLPLLFYIHGGGFSSMSAFAKPYIDFCAAVASQTNAVVVSVEYGLFPDRPIPACYEDSWTALKWVGSHSGGEGPDPWLNNHTDFGKLFIGGDSAGGNISHTLGVRVGYMGLSGVNVVGLILVHPFFGGTEDDQMWLYMCRDGVGGAEDPRLKPPAGDLARLGCERMLIFVAEKDHLNVGGKNYYEELKRSGWRGSVEIVENFGEEHCFHLMNPDHEKALEVINKFVSFMV